MTKAKIYHVSVYTDYGAYDRFFFNKKQALSYKLMMEKEEDVYGSTQIEMSESDRPQSQQEWLDYMNDRDYAR